LQWGEDGVSSFLHVINGPKMHQAARISYPNDPHDAAARDKRDAVVMQAIAIVAARQPMEEWWVASPGVRTHAIYDEIRQLDQAGANTAAEPAEGDRGSARYQAV
jgi:hypothetical protein